MTGPALSTELLVYVATFVYVLGFLFRDQVILRLLVVLGSMIYISYYYVHLTEPQWAAIYGSCMIGLSSMIGLCGVIYSRVPIGIRGDRRTIYDAFGRLEPGEFRRLMRCARVVEPTETATLTTQGVRPGHLFFVMSGHALVEKDGRQFEVPHHCFVGEIGFLLDQPASATVRIGPGSVYLEWERGRLTALLQGAPKLAQALEAMIGRDLADKVARSVRVQTIAIVPAAAPDAPEAVPPRMMAAARTAVQTGARAETGR